MKSFRSFLVESQESHTVSESILKNVDKPPVFFTPTVMKRLNYEKPGFHSFHVTDIDNIPRLVKLQGSRSKQLSTMSPNSNLEGILGSILGGIETGGGVLAVLEGSVTVRMNQDIFTGLVVGGRRTVLISKDSDFATGLQSNLVPVIEKLNLEIRDMLHNEASKIFPKALREFAKFHEQTKIFHKNIIDIADGIEKKERDKTLYFDSGSISRKISLYDLVKLTKERKSDPENRIITSAAGRFVKAYMDGVEKILAKNPEYKSLFVTEESGDRFWYDEYIMHNFKIKKLYVMKRQLITVAQGKLGFGPIRMYGEGGGGFEKFFEETVLKNLRIDPKIVEYLSGLEKIRDEVSKERTRLQELNKRLK